MSTIQTTYNPQYYTATAKVSVFKKFIDWCKSQEEKRFGWMAAMITLHGCVLAPVTLAFVFLGGNLMLFWGFVIGSMAMTLISNLAAMPTKFTIPIFFFSVLLDVFVIVANLVIFFEA